MSISRWEPFSELMPLRDMMNRLMEESFIMPSWSSSRGGFGACPIDVYETDNDVIVEASLPGFRPQDIDVKVTDNVLTIKAQHEEERRAQRPRGMGPSPGRELVDRDPRDQREVAGDERRDAGREEGDDSRPKGQQPADLGYESVHLSAASTKPVSWFS